MTEVNLRIADINDAEQIAKIHVLSWQATYRGYIPDSVLDNLSLESRQKQWTELINNGVSVLVIVKNSLIVGFASICAARDENSDKQTCGEISAIYLAPHVWHQGLGRKLCLAAFNELQKTGFQEVIVWVLKENLQARKFYEAMGFVNTARIKSEPYDDNIILNEVCYQKYLKDKIQFKHLEESDLDLLCHWLDKLHVKEWWNDGLSHVEIKQKYGKRIGDKIVVPYIIKYHDTPIGFIQYYHADQVGEGWWPEEKPGTVGIDQFIGEEAFINRGIGTKVIQAFIRFLFSNQAIKKIITDVDPHNKRAFRCYKKVGFKFVKEINTPEGKSYLLEIFRDSSERSY